MNTCDAVNLLIVEDSSIDVEMFRRALAEKRIGNPLHVASDGVIALEMLRSGTIKKPWLIITDVNMPRMNGIEFLAELRADPLLRDSLVFVMTTSDDERDKVEAYNFNIAGYMLKTDIGDSFFRAVQLVDEYRHIIQFPQ